MTGIYKSMDAKLEVKLDAKLAENNARLQLFIADTVWSVVATPTLLARIHASPSSKPTSISSLNLFLLPGVPRPLTHSRSKRKKEGVVIS